MLSNYKNQRDFAEDLFKEFRRERTTEIEIFLNRMISQGVIKFEECDEPQLLEIDGKVKIHCPIELTFDAEPEMEKLRQENANLRQRLQQVSNYVSGASDAYIL